MVLVVNMTPVMGVDPSGYEPNFIETAWNWVVKRIGEPIYKILHSVPKTDFEIPSFSDLTKSISSLFGGSIVDPLLKAASIKNAKGYNSLMDLFPKGLVQGAGKFLSRLSMALIMVPTVLDIMNIWTANNQNTVLQRLIQTGTSLLTTAISVVGGYFGTALVVTGFAISPVCFVCGVGVSVLGIAVISIGIYASIELQSYIYEKYEIE